MFGCLGFYWGGGRLWPWKKKKVGRYASDVTAITIAVTCTSSFSTYSRKCVASTRFSFCRCVVCNLMLWHGWKGIWNKKIKLALPVTISSDKRQVWLWVYSSTSSISTAISVLLSGHIFYTYRGQRLDLHALPLHLAWPMLFSSESIFYTYRGQYTSIRICHLHLVCNPYKHFHCN